MNDYEYTFAQDVREKKNIAHSAKHKVGRRSGCTLPSDGMSAYQRKKLNGPVQNWNIHEPMTWSAFKSMPADLQQAHLDYISKQFHIGVSVISTDVFGQARATLSAHCTRNGITAPARRGMAANEEDEEALRKWLAGEAEEPVETPACTGSFPSSVKGLTVRLDGSAEEIAQGLRLFLGGQNASVEVRIDFK